MSTVMTRDTKRDVEKILRRLHINTNSGLKYLIWAISETVSDPNRTYLITKDLYWEIARKYKSTPTRVERNIRTAIRICWENAKEDLEELVGHHLTRRPTNKEFIDHIAFYVRSN